MAGENLFQILTEIATKYPTQWPFLQQHPDVLKVFMENFDGHMSDTQFQNALQQTAYYKGTNQDQRNWDQLVITDPATATQRYQAAAAHNTQLWQTLAPSVSYQDFLAIHNQAVRGNWSDDTIKAALLAKQAGLPLPTGPVDSGVQGGGDLGANMNTVKQIAASYAVPIADQDAYKWALDLTSGKTDQAGVTAWAKEQAASLFPGLKTALDSGLTVDQYASPYKSIAQQELGINPNSINWTDPRWNAALNQIDAKTGARTSMSLSDWTTKLRTDPIYGYNNTQGAKDQASQLALKIQSTFGNAA